MNAFQSLAHTGVAFAKNASEKRAILLGNLISLILFGLGTILFIAYYFWYGWWELTGLIEVTAFLCLVTLLLNKFNFQLLSRIWICLLLPVTTVALSIYSKNLAYESQQELDYFTFRFLVLASSVFPIIFFSLQEKAAMFSTSLVIFALLMLFDPLHTLFGVPYQRDVLGIYTYYFTNVVVLITYLILVGAILFLRRISEESERKAGELITELNEKNDELIARHDEIEAQNHEIKAQSENLNISQKKLQDAYKLIEEQKELLIKLNQHLSSELLEINKDLTDTNNELVRHNNELRQFSYTVSHNLRGPVASLSGLINLMDSEASDDEKQEIFPLVRTSIQRLETVIQDLSQIIDVRNDIFQVRKRIDLVKEIDDIEQSYKKEVGTLGITFKKDLAQCREIYSVKPMIHSILCNLISNAIKYRSPDRRPEIKISTRQADKHLVIEVADNGLGIDLKNHKNNLFKLYKRFHYHIEGKGLGLYLVKLQAETLGGYVEVESEINRSTKFTVYIPKPENIAQQILFKSSYASFYYDAILNSTGIVWDGPVSSEQYRHVFTKCLEFVRIYNTPNYIADLTNQGYIMREDQLWMFRNIMPEAARYGLKRIAAVKPAQDDPQLMEYFASITENLRKFNIEQRYFTSYKEASQWIESQNEQLS